MRLYTIQNVIEKLRHKDPVQIYAKLHPFQIHKGKKQWIQEFYR